MIGIMILLKSHLINFLKWNKSSQNKGIRFYPLEIPYFGDFFIPIYQIRCRMIYECFI